MAVVEPKRPRPSGTPDHYFQAHPTYDSEVDGVRVPRGLCATNEQVIDLITQRVAALFREHRHRQVISIRPRATTRRSCCIW